MNRTLLLPLIVLSAVVLGCQADEEALRVNGEPGDYDRADEIEAAPRTPMEITEEGDTLRPPNGTPADPVDTIRADDFDMPESDQPDDPS